VKSILDPTGYATSALTAIADANLTSISPVDINAEERRRRARDDGSEIVASGSGDDAG